MLKKYVLGTGCFLLVSLIACTSDNVAGGTIDPNSNPLAVASSSSALDVERDITSSSGLENGFESSSSSRKSVLSSSSEDSGENKFVPDFSSSSEGDIDADVTSLFARNVSLRCIDDVAYVDLDVMAPYASKFTDGDSVNILINDYFKIPCDESEADAFVNGINTLGNVDLGVVDDTLYVNFARNMDVTYGCECVAEVKFTLDMGYSDPGYTSLEFRNTIPLKKLE